MLECVIRVSEVHRAVEIEQLNRATNYADPPIGWLGIGISFNSKHLVGASGKEEPADLEIVTRTNLQTNLVAPIFETCRDVVEDRLTMRRQMFGGPCGRAMTSPPNSAKHSVGLVAKYRRE
jgi:hypothetical protein